MKLIFSSTRKFILYGSVSPIEMTKRRAVICGLSGLGLVPIAGCLGDEGDPVGSVEQNEDSVDGEDQHNTGDTTGDQQVNEGRAFAIVEWDMPAEVQINEEFSWRVIIENRGDDIGEFAEPLYVKVPGSDWEETGEVDLGEIAPGEEGVYGSDSASIPYINRYEFAVGDFDPTSVLQTISAKISWGSKYTTPSGYEIQVNTPSVVDSYPYLDYSGATKQKSPENGGQWVFIDIFVKNETGQANFSPTASDFDLLYGNQQADSEFILDDPIDYGPQFEGGELQPGIERGGWVLYEIPEDVSADDVRIAWSESTFEGELSVIWEN